MFNFVPNMPDLPLLRVEETDGKRFYYSPSGMKLASVTTMLGYFKEKSLQSWKDRVGHDEADTIKRRAGIRGDKFHKLIERYIRNEENIFEGVMPDMQSAFKNFKPTLDRIDNIQYIEAQLYSETLGLAGRTDAIADFDGVPSFIDHKTSLKPKREEWIRNYFEQKTAYSLMYEEMTGNAIKQIVTLISVDHQPEPQIFIKNRDAYVPSLMEKINIYKKVFNSVS